MALVFLALLGRDLEKNELACYQYKMTIIQIHIERTSGVLLQGLYKKIFPGPEMLWYSARDGLFAPFNIKTANYTKNWQLKMYSFIAAKLPLLRHFMLWIRTQRRRRKAVMLEDLHEYSVITGHFAVSMVLPYLSPKKHSYRVIIRDPLDRMWSHYCYWRAHKGDVGHQVVPPYQESTTFLEFAFLPELKNYQKCVAGDDLSIYEYVGTTHTLNDFGIATGLIEATDTLPIVNHFSSTIPKLSKAFLKKFRIFHKDDYKLYTEACKRTNIEID